VAWGVHVPGVFCLPSALADAAAARAVLAGVTRLEMRGRLDECAQLAAALRHLPGLRAVSLTGNCVIKQQRDVDGLGEDFVATLAGCPAIDSLEWKFYGWSSALGASGARCRCQTRRLGGRCVVSRQILICSTGARPARPHAAGALWGSGSGGAHAVL
jgi:hypothetical protein